MKTLTHVLATLLAVAVVVALIEIAYPKGLVGLLGGWISTPAPVAQTSAGDDVVPPETPAAPPKPAAPVVYGPGASKELGWADRDFDRGDFDGAFANYVTAKSLAANADERGRAVQGLERSVLSWALVRGAPRVNGKPADLESEYQRRLAAAESAQSEQGWIDLARWAAGAGLRERLPYVAGQALDASRPGGAVDTTVRGLLGDSGSRRDALAAALASRGLGGAASAPAVAVHTPPQSRPEATGIGGTASRTEPSAPSGIGGVNERGIPFGAFTPATREKLREAVRLQKEGAKAYQGAAPDDPHRVENRNLALEKLKAARDIYQAAQVEDGNCKDLDDRLKETMLMISQLRKDSGISR